VVEVPEEAVQVAGLLQLGVLLLEQLRQLAPRPTNLAQVLVNVRLLLGEQLPDAAGVRLERVDLGLCLGVELRNI
jgi:hypothetical protein